MKRLFISLILVLFMVSCASLDVKIQEQDQSTFTFPLIGDVNMMLLSPRIFETQKPIDSDTMETISKYNKVIPLVRIVTDKGFRIKSISIQYLKDGIFYAYKFSGQLCPNCGSTEHGDFIFIQDTSLSKKEIKTIIKKMIIIKLKLPTVESGIVLGI